MAKTPLALVDRALEAIARARAPKEPPKPVGAPVAGDEEHLERAPCPLCGATRGRVELVATDDWLEGHVAVGRSKRPGEFAVVRCEVCTGRYTSPRFRREHKGRAFPEDYPFYVRAHAAKRGEGLDPRAREAARRAFLGRADQVSALRPRPGRLLDLGTGDGFFLDIMRERGWEVVGVDVAEIVVWHAREALGIESVHVLDIEADPLPEGPFDVVTMWGVLQLAYRPQRLLEKVHAALAPRGLVGIGVSNATSLGARVFRSRWRGLGLPRHLVHFTPRTLDRVVRWAGFETVDVAYETPRWIVSGSVEGVLPRGVPITKLVKLAAYGAGAIAGRTRLGDTIALYAERS